MDQQYKKYLGILLSLIGSYYIVVFSFNYIIDPFNLKKSAIDFGYSKKKIAVPYNHILYNINEFNHGDYTKVIFGDSRGRALYRKYFITYDDNKWFNFSFGEANILEIIDSVYYAVENNDLEKVLITIPFRVFIDRDLNRFPEALDLVSSPPLYYTNTLVTKVSGASLLYLLKDKVIKTQKQGGKKKAAWRYWIKRARTKAHAWSPARRIIVKLEKLFDHLDKKGVKYTVFLPPLHNDILDEYLPVIGDHYHKYVKFLTSNAETLDCTKAPFIDDYDAFSDPYHFNQENAELIIKEYLSGNNNLCVRRVPEESRSSTPHNASRSLDFVASNES
ncbi:MAG: hypothetical protein GY807_00195 [Gammaproteobacteria bacterium]|nr:hypothetical protein [Gammaproteobacteria bacterium]